MFELSMLVGFGLLPIVHCVTKVRKENRVNTSVPVTAEHIKINCNLRANNLYPCLKQQVYACLETTEGERFYGANWMLNNTVVECPRLKFESGTRYDLCESECGQGTDYHAERQAINACLEAGADTEGAVMYLTGHTYCCDDCTYAMLDAKVSRVVLLDTDKEINYSY
jgi:cytidine deaminase